MKCKGPNVEDALHGTHSWNYCSNCGNNKGGDGVVMIMLKLWQLELFQMVTNTIKILLWQFCYAVDNGAKVINGSFGKDLSSQRMCQKL
jgi:hypothetical protein